MKRNENLSIMSRNELNLNIMSRNELNLNIMSRNLETENNKQTYECK